MKNTVPKLIFLLNYLLVILYLGTFTGNENGLSIHGVVPVFLATLFLMDISYIACCNVTGSRILYLFCGLLALDSWYLLLSFQSTPLADTFFRLLGPVTIYVSVRFILLFLFQGYTYKFKRGVDVILMITGISAAASVFLTERVYAACYGIQFVISTISLLFVILYHHSRISYVMRSEKRALIISAGITFLGFVVYYFATLDIRDHIGNFGAYLTVLIFSLSIHGIALKVSSGVPLSAVFGRRQTGVILSACIGAIGFVSFVFEQSVLFFAVQWNLLFGILFLCNVILEQNLRKKNNTATDSRYTTALEKLRKEEQLKAEFSNFLHDDILQDLLAVKNMAGKSHRPEVRDMIYEAVNDLNVRIRKRMQEYHPVILKSLTVKQNYEQLIKGISAMFPQRHIAVSFGCEEDIFIPEPYDVLTYRLIRELLTNVYKHSDGDCAWLFLALRRDKITLTVSDNGTRKISPESITSAVSQKGIFSAKEQVEYLGGCMTVKENLPCGIRIEIEIPMKGDVSYQHFIS